MEPTDFPQANDYLAKPADMTEEECNGLKVFRGHDESGLPVIISRWTPTEAERESISRGDPVWLWVIGNHHPPINIQTENPFKGRLSVVK
jgi:hypothetical protein